MPEEMVTTEGFGDEDEDEDLFDEEIEDVEEEEEEIDIGEEELSRSFLMRLANPLHLSLFFLALFIDGAEIVLDVIGIIGAGTAAVPVVVGAIAFFLDFCAFLTIGLWLFFKSGTAMISKRALKLGTKAGRAAAAESAQLAEWTAKMTKWGQRLKWLRFLVPLFELIPYVSIVPAWAIIVFLEIKYGE